MKYESSAIYHSKDMTNVKVFCRQIDNSQGRNYMNPDLSMQGHENADIS